ncbi:MAG: hypothetical protein EA425_03010 [Puniceicoccaceae bacterium]|nr:MAG: hypothetical protein EA425_03010 [Puniceicoccaceae bacterium]
MTRVFEAAFLFVMPVALIFITALDSAENHNLSAGVVFFQTSYYAEYGHTLAANVVSTLPVLLVFLLFHRHIIRGITTLRAQRVDRNGCLTV